MDLVHMKPTWLSSLLAMWSTVVTKPRECRSRLDTPLHFCVHKTKGSNEQVINALDFALFNIWSPGHVFSSYHRWREKSKFKQEDPARKLSISFFLYPAPSMGGLNSPLTAVFILSLTIYSTHHHVNVAFSFFLPPCSKIKTNRRQFWRLKRPCRRKLRGLRRIPRSHTLTSICNNSSVSLTCQCLLLWPLLLPLPQEKTTCCYHHHHQLIVNLWHQTRLLSSCKCGGSKSSRDWKYKTKQQQHTRWWRSWCWCTVVAHWVSANL